ncbi:MAG: ATP-binding protein [Pseudomonadota bacterium]
MQLLPSSLFGRLVLVLLIGLLLAQLLSAIILFKDRYLLLSKTQEQYLTQRMAEIAQVLESFAPKEREKIVAILNTLHLRVILNKATLPPTKCLQNQTHLSFFAPFLTKIHHDLGNERTLCITKINVSPTYSFMVNIGLQTSLHPPFVAEVQLKDGNWISFEHVHPAQQDIATTPWRLLITLAVLLMTVLSLSLLAVRWLTRPLAILAEAAEHLGRDIHRPPLHENGPTEVQRAAHAFNTMQARLSRYLEDRARILIAVSHDLKTPITRLRLRVEQLDNYQLRDSFLKDLNDMQTMTAATLDFMRGLENSEPVQPLDIRALLESLQADYEDMGLSVALQGDTPEPYPARPQSLKRCLVNLIDNAHKYGQRVTITLKNNTEQLQIIVADEGPGIPQAALETVFEPFYRLETSRSRATGGTGLGLSIARNITRAHGGDIILRNRQGGGLEATVNLPKNNEPLLG